MYQYPHTLYWGWCYNMVLWYTTLCVMGPHKSLARAKMTTEGYICILHLTPPVRNFWYAGAPETVRIHLPRKIVCLNFGLQWPYMLQGTVQWRSVYSRVRLVLYYFKVSRYAAKLARILGCEFRVFSCCLFTATSPASMATPQKRTDAQPCELVTSDSIGITCKTVQSRLFGG